MAANESLSKSNKSPAGAFVKGLQSQAIEDFGEDPDQVYFKPGSLLTLETGVRISNLKPVKQNADQDLMKDDDSMSQDSQEEVGYQPNRQLNVKVVQFTIFTNTKRSTLADQYP